MAQQNGCSMDLAVDEDGLEVVDGVVVDESAGVINGHSSSAMADGEGAAAAAGPSSSLSSSSARDISHVDRDVIRLIAQHLQNLGLKYDNRGVPEKLPQQTLSLYKYGLGLGLGKQYIWQLTVCMVSFTHIDLIDNVTTTSLACRI